MSSNFWLVVRFDLISYLLPRIHSNLVNWPNQYFLSVPGKFLTHLFDYLSPAVHRAPPSSSFCESFPINAIEKIKIGK